MEINEELQSEGASVARSKGKDIFSVPTWKFGCKSSSMVQPEKYNKDGEGEISEERMQEFEKKIDYSKGNFLSKSKSFNSSFMVDIDDIEENVDDKTGHSVIGQSECCSEWNNLQIEPSLPLTLKFEDVKYQVHQEKYILHGITGSAHPGEFLALMGPSGSGKTTLLNLLSGRLKFNSGAITFNGLPDTKFFKRRIGFVTQDDVVFSHLTVKETLTYAALLRLPKSLSREDKLERAMDVIIQLGLQRSQNTVIGGKCLRGTISGGERKRVCIGNEILLNPSLLLLDEPTSGLDSTTAFRIIRILQEMAKNGKTVVSTIHQPSSKIFSTFDKLILLGNGSSLYFGKASEAMVYFSSIGCTPLIAMNPAEFLIDLANGNITDKSFPSQTKPNLLCRNTILKTKEEPSPTDVREYLIKAYEAKVGKREKRKLLKPSTIDDDEGKLNPMELWSPTWLEQFSILVSRSFKERRHEHFSFMRVTQVVATAIIIGLLWWNSDSSSPNDLEDQAGLLFFISVFWSFLPLFTAIFTFPQEREMLAKERAVGMYRLTAYFAARNITDLPLDLMLPTVFIVIVYFMVGLKMSFAAFSLTMLTVFLAVIASQGLGFAIGAAFMDVKKATAFASIIIMSFMLSGGFFLQNIPSFMSWIRYVSFNYHTYRLLVKLQYSCSDSAGESNPCKSPVLAELRVDSAKEVAAIMAMVVAYRLLAYLLLRKIKLPKMS